MKTKNTHSWLDPVLVQEQVDAIRDALIEIDPREKKCIRQMLQDFNERLQGLDQEFQEAFRRSRKSGVCCPASSLWLYCRTL